RRRGRVPAGGRRGFAARFRGRRWRFGRRVGGRRFFQRLDELERLVEEAFVAGRQVVQVFVLHLVRRLVELIAGRGPVAFTLRAAAAAAGPPLGLAPASAAAGAAALAPSPAAAAATVARGSATAAATAAAATP